MDYMVPWVMLVLLLLIVLPHQSCGANESVNCTGPDVDTNSALQFPPYTSSHVTYKKCTTSNDLSRRPNNSMYFEVHVGPPVTVDFRLEYFDKIKPFLVGEVRIVSLNVPNICDVGVGAPIQLDTDSEDSLRFKTLTVHFKESSVMVVTSSSATCLHIMTVEFQSRTIQKSNSRRNGLVLALGIAAGLVALILVAVVVVMRRRLSWHKLSPVNSRNSKDSEFSSVHDLSDLEVGAPRLYTYKELSGATQNFSSKYVVGEGGFGTAYKGVLKDTPYPVAIKRLSQYARQGAREFVAEVKIISQLRHRNLVQLLGWCLEKDELILVYEYMTNGDLDELLYADKPKCDLCWKQRFNVLCGVSTALVYLHEEWVQRVVHRDVKTSNVMLDSNLNARLGDFGLARLSAHSQAPQSTLVAGTLGYLAPEFSMSGKATDKTDVYAFGVVALEVTCARRPLSPDLILVDWVWDLHKQDKLLDAVDPRLELRSSDDEIQMKIVLQLGLLCAHPDPNARPSMRQVLNMLTGEASVPRVPRSKPVASYFEDD